jgi:hypothetical protein
MTWIKVIDVTEAEGALREAYNEVASTRGEVGNIPRYTTRLPSSRISILLTVLLRLSALNWSSNSSSQLLECIQRRANLHVRWALAVIRFNLYPGDLPVLVDYINRRVRDAVDFLPFICGITQSVGVNDLVIGIRKNWKAKRSLTIRPKLLGKALANIWRIDADRVQLYVFTLL